MPVQFLMQRQNRSDAPDVVGESLCFVAGEGTIGQPRLTVAGPDFSAIDGIEATEN